MAEHCGPKTAERYRQLAAYVLPALKDVPLQKISALLLERLYRKIRLEGGKRRMSGGSARPLAARTIGQIASLMHASLGTAVRWKRIRTNPADACELPRIEKREAHALDPQQTERYLDAARGTFMYPLLVVAAATGCRRGELLALTWNDIDPTAQPPVVVISRSLEQTREGLRIKTPQNGKPRILPVPATAIKVLDIHQRERGSGATSSGWTTGPTSTWRLRHATEII